MPTVFICVSGISPAIVTETLQAMADQGVHPDEMHVVTTAIGKADLCERLRGPREPFAQLSRQMGLSPELLRDDHIHVIAGADGGQLSDIVSQQDAAALAKTIGELVRRFTADPDTRVYASLAGGRKTMSFWIGCAMTLFGRAQDRLTHVLVNEPFELCGDFFFKPAEPEMVKITGRDPTGRWEQGAEISTEKAEINLGYVPFPRMRPRLAGSHWLELDRPLDIERLIEDVNLAEAGPVLEFDDEARTVRFGDGLEIHLRSAKQYALYRLCAEAAAGRLPHAAAAARRGMLTIDDFVLGGRVAAHRLRAILQALGSEEALVGHLDHIVDDWDAAVEEALWTQVHSVERETADAARALKVARNAEARTETKLSTARNRLDTANRAAERAAAALAKARDGVRGPTGKQRKDAQERLDAAELASNSAAARRAAVTRVVEDLRTALADAKQQTTAAHRRHAELTARRREHEANPLVPAVCNAVEMLIEDLRQARVRLDGVLNKQIGDDELRGQLKLTRSDKPFAVGLHPRLRNPQRIRFADDDAEEAG